jgi:hypothetical protein
MQYQVRRIATATVPAPARRINLDQGFVIQMQKRPA